jgi:hypothetical protein
MHLPIGEKVMVEAEVGAGEHNEPGVFPEPAIIELPDASTDPDERLSWVLATAVRIEEQKGEPWLHFWTPVGARYVPLRSPEPQRSDEGSIFFDTVTFGRVEVRELRLSDAPLFNVQMFCFTQPQTIEQVHEYARVRLGFLGTPEEAEASFAFIEKLFAEHGVTSDWRTWPKRPAD